MTRAVRGMLLFLALACAAGVAPAQSGKFPPETEGFQRPKDRAAALYKPAGPGPFPAVVLSHTCAGLYWHVFGWAERLVAAGYVALVLDHLGPRRVPFNCPKNNPVSVTDYAKDGYEALRFLRSKSYVDGARVAHVGFSYGAMAGLRIAGRAFAERHAGGAPNFAAVAALYPWCNEYTLAERPDHQWNFQPDTDTPLLLLLGGADDEASPRSCVEQARANAASGLPVEWKVYDGATHLFDVTNQAGRHVVVRSGSYTYRGNAEHTEQAWQDMKAFLGKRLAR